MPKEDFRGGNRSSRLESLRTCDGRYVEDRLYALADAPVVDRPAALAGDPLLMNLVVEV